MTKPNREHAQEGVRGSGAPLSAMAVRHSEEEGSDRHSDRNHCTEHTNMVNKRLLDKIEKRREEEEQHVAGLSEVFQARVRSHSEGYSLIDRRTYIERLNQDKGNLREREGVLAGLDTAMDIVEADRAEGRSITSTEASEGSGREAPPRPLTRREPRVKEEAPSRQDASTPEFRGHSRSPRAPLASPGPPPTTPHTATPRPVPASGGIGRAASWPGSHPMLQGSHGSVQYSRSWGREDKRVLQAGPIQARHRVRRGWNLPRIGLRRGFQRSGAPPSHLPPQYTGPQKSRAHHRSSQLTHRCRGGRRGPPGRTPGRLPLARLLRQPGQPDPRGARDGRAGEGRHGC